MVKHKTSTFEEKYKILGTRNTELDGIFFTAVKTTGIFCLPSCRARTPKAENVVFYNSAQEALHHGYRPCKVCKPMENIGEIPDYIQSLLTAIQKNPEVKITDEDLKAMGLKPHTIRRWFKKNHQLTFHAFQRLMRMNYAFNDIKNGKSIIHSAFDSGYQSLSGFNNSYRSIFGVSASNSRNKTIIHINRISTPIGSIVACATDKGICFLGFIGQKHFEQNMQSLQKALEGIILPGKNKHLIQVKKELKEYFAGERMAFEVSLDLIGTDFSKEVWRTLLNIPYGKTISYSDQAKVMQKEKAIRAIASANGKNKISILIPCHRVIGTDGSMTGYAGGIHKKHWLLTLEKRHTNQPSQASFDF